MRDRDQLATDTVCPQCGAERFGTRAECWLCGAVVQPEPATKYDAAQPAVSFALSTVMLFMTLACVCFGLLAIAPGLGMFVCVVLLPVFVRTVMVVNKREERGIATSQVEKILLFMGSFFVAITIVIIVPAAAFSAFCLSCLVGFQIGAGGSERESLGALLGFAGGGAVMIGMIILVSKRVAARYRRDVQD